MSDENEWSISFNPGDTANVDPDDMKDALNPYAYSVEKKAAHRYEIVLNDVLPGNPPMGEVITEVILMLGQLYPAGYVVGHVDAEADV